MLKQLKLYAVLALVVGGMNLQATEAAATVAPTVVAAAPGLLAQMFAPAKKALEEASEKSAMDWFETTIKTKLIYLYSTFIKPIIKRIFAMIIWLALTIFMQESTVKPAETPATAPATAPAAAQPLSIGKNPEQVRLNRSA